MRNLRKSFLKKRTYFYYPLILQCMQIIWVNVFKNTGLIVELSLINTLSLFIYIMLSIFDAKFHYKTSIFENIYLRLFACTVKLEDSKNVFVLLKTFAQILRNFAHLSVLKNKVSFVFKTVFKF